MARFILGEYIGHYFATYNVYIFPVDKDVTVASFFIKFVSNRIFNAEIKSIISSKCLNVFDVHCKCVRASCPHPRKIIDYFVNSEKAISMVYAIKMVKNILADLFMTYSYIIMLNGVYNTQDRILDEKDALTGRSKKELFLDIYYSLLNKVKNYLEKINIGWLYQNIVIYDDSENIGKTTWDNGIFENFDIYVKKIYTQLETCYYVDSQNINNLEIDNIRMILNHIKSPISFKYDIQSESNRSEIYYKFITELYDIHPISVIAEITHRLKEKEIKSETKHNLLTGFNRSGNLFPQNRVTYEVLNKVRIYEPKLFTSLESAYETIVQAKEDAILGNNANYSFIGGLGGSVSSEEENIEKLVAPSIPGDNSIQFDHATHISKESAALGSHRLQVEGLIDEWNELFKIAILGGKDLVIPPQK
jgi:hypothetical protein